MPIRPAKTPHRPTVRGFAPAAVILLAAAAALAAQDMLKELAGRRTTAAAASRPSTGAAATATPSPSSRAGRPCWPRSRARRPSTTSGRRSRPSRSTAARSCSASIGRRKVPFGRSAGRRSLRRRPRLNRDFVSLPVTCSSEGRPELLLVHAVPPVVPGHGDERRDPARRRVLLLHRLP